MLSEDPTLYLQDFGVTVQAGGVEGLGIFDTPGDYIHNERVITNEYLLRAETSKFGNLLYDDTINVGGESFVVREAPLMVDDGTFCLVLLSKAVGSGLQLEDGGFLLLETGGNLQLE